MQDKNTEHPSTPDTPSPDSAAPLTADTSGAQDALPASTPDTESEANAGDDTGVTGSAKNSFSRVPVVFWVVTILLAALTGLGGYMVGYDRGQDKAAQAHAAADAAPGGEGTPERSPEEAAALAKKVKPGKGPAEAKKGDDGTFDATISGPGKPFDSVEQLVDLHRRNPADPFAVGPVDAPVVISEFSDFECPFCARYTNETEPMIMDDYVNKGLVRVEWNDMPINGPNAEAGAKAGRAAAAQGKFFAFKHALYEHSKDISGHPNYTIDDYVRFAQEAGVKDIDRFRADATSDKYDQVIQEARGYATSIGLNGTPAFVIGNTFVAGAQPAKVFQDAITQELAKVGAGEIEVPKTGR